MIEKVGYKSDNIHMEGHSKLLKELSSLPKGYISKKTIHGKERFYLQWKEDGKLKSRYIKEDELDDIRKSLARRKQIAEILASASNKSLPLARIGQNASSLTGDIMSGDDAVARFENGVLVWMDEKRVPLAIKRGAGLSYWLSKRSIDDSRANARRLKAYLEIKGAPSSTVSLMNRSLSITDSYWFRPKGSKTKFMNLRDSGDAFSFISLEGRIPEGKLRPSINPELTNIGSYEKGWRLLDGEWWMLKKGSPAELFSEWFCCELAYAIGIPTVRYVLEKDMIRSRNFADRYDLEMISSIAGEDDGYENVFTKILEIKESLASSYLSLMWFDCLIWNVDRHNENLGLLRDKKSGRIAKLAPNFDLNMALFGSGMEIDGKRRADGLMRMFSSFLRENDSARRLYLSLKIPEFDNSTVEEILKHDPKVYEFDKEKLIDFLLEGQNRLCNLLDD